MIRLSLCMIVKNEEAVLTRVLASAIQFADEILVADTGSTDRTVEIARQYTKHIYHYPWNDDFAAARNFICEKVTTEYWMWLDADDVVRSALADLDKGRSLSVPGAQYKAIVAATRVVPPSVQRVVVRGLQSRLPGRRG